MAPPATEPSAVDLAIEPIRPDDEAELAALLERSDRPEITRHFRPFPLDAASARSIARHEGDDRYLGGRKGGRLVGLAMLRGWDDGYAVPSFGVLVDLDEQGAGLGRRLTEHAVDEARRLGAPAVRLTVDEGNVRARRIYDAVGFAATGERSSDGERLVLVRRLDPPPIAVSAPALVGNEAAYVQDAVASTWISSTGPYVDRFEAMVAAWCEVEHAVACCNGTAALHLALLGAGVEPGDEVVVPVLCFVACANAIRMCGATPVLVDVDPEHGNLDPAAVAAAVGPRTTAVLVPHLYGHPADVDAIRAVADRHGLAVVEDAAEAHGARYRGRAAGSLGDVASLSFFGNKIVTTGEGGMVLTDDAAVADRVRLLRGQGQDPARRYWHLVQGFNYRLSNVAAAIGVAQMERADEHVAERRRVARRYRELLADDTDVAFGAEAAWAESAHWMSAVRLAVDVDAVAVATAMAGDGIETRPSFHPLHHMPAHADLGQPGRFPVAEALAPRLLCLPSHRALDDDALRRVVRSLRRALGAARSG